MNLRAVIVAGLIVAALPGAAPAGELSGNLTLASEYVYRGQALSDGNPAVQGGIDYAHDSGFFIGAWASTVDLPGPGGRRDAELDFYAGYHYATDAPLAVTISLIHYSYPGQTTVIDYDYTEALFTASWRDRYSLEVGYTNDVYGFDVSARHLELRADWPLRNAWVVSAGVGVNDLENLGSSRYAYGDIGASARFSRLMVDLRWYDNEEPSGFIGQWSAGSQLVASLTLAF